jgi:hypothetical protein
MRRVFVVVLGVGVVALAGGFLSLGAFPPKPPQQAVHQLVPTDKLAPPPT